MDVRLENGVIRQNGLGLPETADGLDALLQRAYIRLNAVRGSFPYDRALGSRIPQMAITAEHAVEQALGFAREAHLRQNVFFHTDPDGHPVWKDTFIYARLSPNEH